MKYFFYIACIIIYCRANGQDLSNDSVKIVHYDENQNVLKVEKKYGVTDRPIAYTVETRRFSDSLYRIVIFDKNADIKKVQFYKDSTTKIKHGVVFEFVQNKLVGIGKYSNNEKVAERILFNNNTNPDVIKYYKDGTEHNVEIEKHYFKQFNWHPFMEDLNNKQPWDSLFTIYPMPIQKLIKGLEKKI